VGITFLGGTFTDLGDTIQTADRIGTQNRFYGGQIGLRAHMAWSNGGPEVSVLGKVAIGATQESIDITGNTTLITAGTQTTALGGQLALPSNIGHFTKSEFAVIPELDLKVGMPIRSNIKVFVGYDVLFWSRVVRPADQTSLLINDTQMPLSFRFGQPSNAPFTPLVPFRQSEFWAQGVNLGLEFRY
jgi:hypothetical protein